MPDVLLTEKQIAAWENRITAAKDHTKQALEQGRTNIERYNSQFLDAPKQDEVVVPTDFYFVEQKKSQLFYRLPDVFLKAEQPGLEDKGVVFQAALNKKLGPAGVNVLPRIQEVLFDVLCPTGFGALKIGYESVVDGKVEVETKPAGVDPLTGMPTAAVVESVPNIIASRYFIERIPPGDLLVPADFTGSDFDEAPWLGMRFKEDVPDDDETGGTDAEADERRLTPLSSAAQSARRKQKTGYEIYCKARRFFPQEKHPDVIYCFTLYDDQSEQIPVVVKPCPYQTRDEQTGRLEGMVGYPIAPLTIRYVSDSWLVRSDCSMARAQADELSKGRTQMILHRDRAMPQVGYNTTIVDPDTLAKIAKNETGAFIGFTGPGVDATWPIQKGEFGRENFTFNDYTQNDLERIWGLGANQQGVLSDTTRTATELQITQAASQTRLESERSKVLDWYTQKVVAKFAALLQQFADEVEFVELVGQDAQRLKQIPPEAQQIVQQNPQLAVLVPWTKADIFGRYSFMVKPDSQLHLDVVQQREQLLKLFNFLANEPTANRTALTQEVFKLFHYDPLKMTQQPPPHTPEPPKGTFAIKMEDFVGPQGPITVEIAQQLGFKISPEAILQSQQMLLMAEQLAMQQDMEANAQKEHGGSAPEAKKINKHPTEATGGMQGSGASAPIAPGGQLM